RWEQGSARSLQATSKTQERSGRQAIVRGARDRVRREKTRMGLDTNGLIEGTRAGAAPAQRAAARREGRAPLAAAGWAVLVGCWLAWAWPLQKRSSLKASSLRSMW